jgi:DNA repair protein RecO (recombination protein O)
MPARERSFRVEAVVLRHSDYGEADRILVIYTRDKGKLRVIAKGVRKIRSRKAGHLEPFTRASLQLAAGRDMAIVTQADTVDTYLPMRDDLVKTGLAAYAIEVVDRFTYEEEANPAIYRLLTDTLERISAQVDPTLALRYYDLHLLDLLGFRPELFRCLGCGEEIQPQDQYFSVAQGGIYCPNCGVGRVDATPISMETLKYLRHLLRSSYPEAARAVLSAPVRAEMEAIIQRYIQYLLERSLNTPGFIRDVNRG